MGNEKHLDVVLLGGEEGSGGVRRPAEDMGAEVAVGGVCGCLRAPVYRG